MLYLLIALAICLVVPWLPFLLLRLAPVRPAPPLSREEMERLRAQLFPKLARSPTRPQPSGSGREAITAPRQARQSNERGHEVERQRSPNGSDSPPRKQEPRLLTVRSYQWVNLVVLPVFLVSMLGLGILWALLFDVLGEKHAESFPPGVFVFKPAVYWAVFGVPAVFLGIFASAGIVEPLTRILLGRRYVEYCHWEQARRGLHGPVGVRRYGRKWILFACVLGSLMALWVLLAMNWYVRLTDDAIALKPLFGLREQVYPYNRVQQMVLTSHLVVKKAVIPREGLHFRFDDGQTWSTGQTFILPETPEARKRLLEFLVRKTGKPLTQAKVIEQVPGW